jgi:hypothetical protein
MKPSCKIDPTAYALMLQGVNSGFITDKKGDQRDFGVFFNDLWVSDSAVIERVTKVKGEWAVNLLFAHIDNPLTLIIRFIVSHPCPKRAKQKAYYMRRLAAKDQRGTLFIHIGQFNHCSN